MTLRTPLLPAALAAAALLSACAVPAPATTPESSAARRGEPTYQSAAANPFIASSRAAVDELVKGLNTEELGEAPVLVATVVNVNDLRSERRVGKECRSRWSP